jgi:hypothetical protein
LQTLKDRGVDPLIIKDESKASGFRGASAFSKLPYMDMQWSFPPEYMHMTKNNVHRIMQILAGRDYTVATMTAIRDYGMHKGMMVMPGMIVTIGVLSAYMCVGDVCGGGVGEVWGRFGWVWGMCEHHFAVLDQMSAQEQWYYTYY